MRRVFWACCALGLLMIPALAAAGADEGEPCPLCPEGCIPQDYVEYFRENVPAFVESCPAGCVALASVKSLWETPLCVAESSPQAEPEAAPVLEPDADEQPRLALPPPSPEAARTDPLGKEPVTSTLNRITLSPTALGLPKGYFSLTGYGAGLWELEMGWSDHLQLGVLATLPIMLFSAFPTVQYHSQISEHWSAAIGGTAGFFVFYALLGTFGWGAAGSVHFSYEKGPHLLNLSVIGGTGMYGSHAPEYGLIMPSVGYRYKFHPRWTFQLEGTVPIPVSEGPSMGIENILILVFYGVRGHGDFMFGDLGFCYPFQKYYFKGLWRLLPIGIPYFSLGFTF